MKLKVQTLSVRSGELETLTTVKGSGIMKYGLVVGFAGLALVSGCSGTYVIGTVGSGGAPLASAGAFAGESAGGPAATASGGADGPGAAASGGAGDPGSSPGSAAAPSASAGSTNNPGATGYCGVALPSAHDVAFASPEIVYDRVVRFILNIPATPGQLAATMPAETTREWAGDLALGILDSLNATSTPGMNRFVSAWWAGTPNAPLWARSFSSQRGTLADLLSPPGGDPPESAGILTDPAVLSLTSISARGTFIAQNLLCINIPLPPAGVNQKISPPAPGQTLRAQLESATAQQPCRVCHRLIDPPGFALGHFTVDGTYQSTENGLPIETSATMTVPPGPDLTFVDVRDLGSQLKDRCEVAMCFTQSLLVDARRSLGVADAATTDPAEVAELAMHFAESGLNLRALLRLIVESDSFLIAP